MKNESKMLLKLHKNNFLKLNIFSIILNIIYYSIINFTAFYYANNFPPKEVTDMILSGNFMNGSARQNILVFGFELFVVMIKVGVQYSMLDFLFETGDSKIKHPFQDSIQVFSAKYFASVILIWVISNMLVQIGMAVLIVPGIYFYLVFSQTYFTYKRGNRDDMHAGIFTAFISSGLIMNGVKIKYLMLDLSFIGWDILNALTFGLLSFWLTPYKNMTYSLFYKKLVDIKNPGM